MQQLLQSFLLSLLGSAVAGLLSLYTADFFLKLHVKILERSNTIGGFYFKLYTFPLIVMCIVGAIPFYYLHLLPVPVRTAIFTIIVPLWIATYFVWVYTRLRKVEIMALRIYLQRKNWHMNPYI